MVLHVSVMSLTFNLLFKITNLGCGHDTNHYSLILIYFCKKGKENIEKGKEAHIYQDLIHVNHGG
ncbi:hypothetical protein HanIR_Chr03g0111951 [Helianthus annuus]|nr:hypothetical protein HanIR_Chr03g0111951 [Helianthus annuus]